VNERRGGTRRLLVAIVAPWLLRWVLLQDNHQRFWPPGLDENTLVHVVCPQPGCDNQDWVTKYERGTVTKCSLHRPDLPRIRMVRCPECRHHRGYHSPPAPG
jgi:hypothetical protein